MKDRVIEGARWMCKASLDCCHVQLGLIIFVFHLNRNPCGDLLYDEVQNFTAIRSIVVETFHSAPECCTRRPADIANS